MRDAWADTTTPHGRLILTVLGGLAEFERRQIAARTSEGRKRVRANGVMFGRPRKLTPHQARDVLKHVEAGEPMREIALSFKVDHSTISRLRRGAGPRCDQDGGFKSRGEFKCGP